MARDKDCRSAATTVGDDLGSSLAILSDLGKAEPCVFAAESPLLSGLNRLEKSSSLASSFDDGLSPLCRKGPSRADLSKAEVATEIEAAAETRYRR